MNITYETNIAYMENCRAYIEWPGFPVPLQLSEKQRTLVVLLLHDPTQSICLEKSLSCNCISLSLSHCFQCLVPFSCSSAGISNEKKGLLLLALPFTRFHPHVCQSEQQRMSRFRNPLEPINETAGAVCY